MTYPCSERHTTHDPPCMGASRGWYYRGGVVFGGLRRGRNRWGRMGMKEKQRGQEIETERDRDKTRGIDKGR